MPPKKIATSKPTSKSKPKVTQQKKIVKSVQSKSSGKSGSVPSKSGSKTKIVKKKVVSKEDIAANKIQSIVRSFLAKHKLKRLRKEREDYEELIDKLQKQAYVEIVQRQREEDEKERLKEEEQRKKKREELKWKKDLLEAAFDGELDVIKNILRQAEECFRQTSNLTGTALDLFIEKYKMSLIECTDANENSALSEASAGGDADTIIFFLKNGSSINSLGQFHRTPIYRAAFGGHLAAVKVLLENGGDPRIQDNDGVTPAEISASPDITELMNTWDLTKTDELVNKINEEREQKIIEEQKHQKIEQNKIKSDIEECEKEYSSKQKILQKAYQELNKRIFEHDKCTAEGFDRTDVTLQAIHTAEEDLLKAQKEEVKCREQLMKYRMELREKSSTDDEDDLNCVKCNIKQLDEILMRDVGNKIKESGKWPLLIDPSTQAVTFIRYRDTNYLNALNPKQMEVETFRLALLGAIRYGKLFVLDMMDVNMFEFIKQRMNEIEDELFQSILDRNILKNNKFLSLIRKSDGADYEKDKFVESRIERFTFVLVTKMWQVPAEWKDIFYAIKIITPSK